MMGHNNPPRDRNFKKRWAAALFAHPKKPAGAVALAFRLYCAMDGEGRGAVISDKEFCDATGMSQRSTVNFKAWLIDEGFIHIHVRGYRGSASEFVAHIPQLDAPPAPNHAAGLQASDASISKGTHASDASSKPRLGEPGASIPQLDAPPAPNPKTSPAPARAEDNINIYNNYNNLTTKPNQTQSNKIPNTAREYEALAKTLTETCNGALDNPVNCQGLAGLATPIMWLREGCDLELDILPTLHGYGKSAHGKKIRSWDYFTKGVQKARDARLQGLPIEPVSRGAKSRAPNADDTIRQIDAIVRGGR